MGECIIGVEDNWGLQAIVHPPLITSDFFSPQSYTLFEFSQVGGDDSVESPNNDALLEELCKPFYQLPSSLSFTTDDDYDHKMKGRLDDSAQPPTAVETPKQAPKYKRRKSELKRVVNQVRAEELSEDKWAWRKYGQKPIKGSPYPRSYYRCSSLKGCPARKQVEQSKAEPGMFTVTYTAEHSHSQPTKRNSLAGTIRNKFIVPAAASSSPKTTPSPSDLSPRDESMKTIKDEDGAIVERMVEISDQRTQEMVDDSNEDFFAGLEDLDGLMSQFCYPSQYYPSVFYN